MTKEEQQKLVSERDHIVIHKLTDTVITKHRYGTEVYAVEIIRQPLVRCKDCKHYKQSESFCENGNGLWQAGDECFCSYGEREGE